MDDVFKEINQAEVSRVSELLPEALRSDAHILVGLLEEYYRYLSGIDSQGDLPSRTLNTLDDNYSIDSVSQEYLPKIKQYIAPYVPNSTVLDTKQLYSKIVKYFYNARGSRESALVFFKIFFGNTETEIFDITDTSPGISSGWIPYTYGIKTGIPLSEWEIPYRALVHPVGFRFFAYLLFVLISYNRYDLTASAKVLSGSPIKIEEIEKYFCFKTSIVNNKIDYSLLSPEDNPYSNPLNFESFGYGSHSPTYQPGWFEGFIRKLLFLFTNGSAPFTQYNSPGTYSNGDKAYTGTLLSFEQLSQISFVLYLSTYLNTNHHLQNLRNEYQGDMKFRDPSVIASFMGYILGDAIIPEWYAFNPSQFQNVGSYISRTSSASYNAIVSTSGMPIVNGTYSLMGNNPEVPGYPYYLKIGSTNVYLYRSSSDPSGVWILASSLNGSGTVYYEQQNTGAENPWDGIFVTVDGIDPAPTVTHS